MIAYSFKKGGWEEFPPKNCERVYDTYFYDLEVSWMMLQDNPFYVYICTSE